MRNRRQILRGRTALVLLILGAALLLAPLLGAADPAPPARLKALIVEGQSNHGWQETTAALQATLLNTGRFAVDVSTTPPEGASPAQWAGWQPTFTNYDVVLTDYKGQMWPEGVRLSLEKYISGGGGLVIVHAPLATFITPDLLPGEEEWAAYSQMMALGWRSSHVLRRREQGHHVRSDLGDCPTVKAVAHSYFGLKRRSDRAAQSVKQVYASSQSTALPN